MAEDQSEKTTESREWPDTAKRPDDHTGATLEGETPSKPEDRADRSGVEEGGSEEIEEDTAQANARSEIVSEDELPAHTPDRGTNPGFEHEANAKRRSEHGRPEDDPETPPEHGRVVSEPTDERPSLEELREELNEQFESIKIVRPGEYELNLMELYDRDEYIISLQEDGRYVIDVPDSWRNTDE